MSHKNKRQFVKVAGILDTAPFLAGEAMRPKG